MIFEVSVLKCQHCCSVVTERAVSSPVQTTHSLSCSFPFLCRLWWQKRNWTNKKHYWLMRMKTREHYSSHTNCHPLLLETRRISNADIAAGCCFQLRWTRWTWSGYPALCRCHGVEMEKALEEKELFRICEESCRTFPSPPPLCHSLSRVQGLQREGWHKALHPPSVVPGWILSIRLDSSWCAISERSNKEEKKWEGNVSWATTTVRSSRRVQKRDWSHSKSSSFCRDHPQVMRVRKPSPWITKTKLLK